LIEEGHKVINDSLCGYIRWALPYLPEEGVQAIKSYLMTDEMLAHVSFHIGTLDLILSDDYPPSSSTMREVFEAVIGALTASDPSAASRLVLDLVATQLHGKDLTDVWNLKDPMTTLAKILENENRGEPESRLLWAGGKDTILACYHVGIYSDKELIGKAPGETPEIAEEMAALDALKKLFNFDDAHSKPLPFSRDLKNMKQKTESNPSVEDWKSSNIRVV